MTTLSLPTLRRPANPTGIWAWVTTVDHKKIGILYGVTAMINFLIGGIEALMIRVQLAGSNSDIVTPEVYNQLFTMHGTTMIFLAIMPLGAAFFNYIIPLQIGARDVAFPRLNAFSYWVFLAGTLMLHLSWFLGGAPNAGWFAYAPLTEIAYNPGHGIDFWIVSLQLLGIASMAAAFNFVVTIINMRAPGMTMMRMPLFTWMTLITSILLVLAFPVITVALIQLLFDRNYGMNFFFVAAGADPVLWQHLFWVFGHPEVYILILPAMGIVSEVLPTFSKKPLFGYSTVVLAGIVIAFMGWMVWSHHMFTVGLGPIPNAVFTITTIAIAVPTGIKIFNWMATLWKGSIEYRTPMLFAIGFIVTFTIGGVSGVMHAMSASDAQQQDTYFVVAHFHYVLFGGSIMGVFAGLYYWFPKFSGRMYNEGEGKIHFWLMFIGQNLTFFPMHFLGMDGMPRRIYTYAADMGWTEINALQTAGAFVIALSMLFFLKNMIMSWRSGRPAPSDPWDARTLEWSISSPPPEYNFEEIPVVQDRDDWWARKRGLVPQQAPSGGSVGGHGIHMPQASFWPLVAAIGLFIGGYGVIYNVGVLIFGTAVMLVGVYSWSFEPVNDPAPDSGSHGSESDDS